MFHDEWNDPKRYILSKTVGFSALMEALNKLVPFGASQGALNYSFFERVLLRFKALLNERGLQLTSSYFSSSGADRSKLSDFILEAAEIKDIV